MNKQGIIQAFETEKHALDAGFETILTEPEVKALTPLDPLERHAALARMREAATRRDATGKAKRREKSRAARKARKAQRGG